MHVARWGNSLAVRIPSSVAKLLDLKEGDEIDIVARDRQLEIDRKMDRDSALAAIRGLARPLPPGWKFDREAEIMSREPQDG